MSDVEENTEEKLFTIDRAKQGRAACKKCKEKCPVAELRIAKVVPSPFGTGKMKNWYHLDCLFEQFLKQRVTTVRIQSTDDIGGFDDLDDGDKEDVAHKIEESKKNILKKYGVDASPSKANPSKASPKKNNQPAKQNTNNVKIVNEIKEQKIQKPEVTDGLFRDFRRVVVDVSNVSSYTDKTNIIKKMFTKGSNGTGFKGNITQWCRLLLPGDCKRIYNLQSKQLIKHFSKILDTDQETMMESLKQGDMGDTILHYFQKSQKFKPASKSTLSIQEVDDFLEKLSQLTKEDDQINHFKTIIPKCTGNDLKIIVRLVKHDLRMNAGAKHVLQAIHPDAYQVYQSSKDLGSVIKRCWDKHFKLDTDTQQRVKACINVMTPIQPMLAEACKSIEQAMKKCTNGMYAEIKYDGERVQLHKLGSEFKYFSRSLKPVLSHKVSHFKDYIPEAFPEAHDLILDSEILMIDTDTGKPLPFGTLGVHKKAEFKDANVCLFVFDCIYYNGESLVTQPIDYRKEILQKIMTEIPNRVLFSELEIIHKSKDLSKMINKVLEMGLEGLVLKDLKSIYEPGKRHWLKVKKDYLNDGAMADTADLIVLGAWYGTGKKAGMMSVFLMGCYDEDSQKFCTVTKVHTGHDDKTLEQLQTELKMVEINSNTANIPLWLKCTKTMIPDFVAKDPKQQPVWEITGAEFTQHDVHTADGISIRFPRVTKIRSDKNWNDATTLHDLKKLYQTSKENTDVKLLMNIDSGNEDNVGKSSQSPKESKSSKQSSSATKRKRSDEKLGSSPKISKTDKNFELEAEHKITDPLPNLFENVKLLVEGDKKQFEKCLRYFIAYGGTILDPDDWEDATHVLHIENSIRELTIHSANSARHINSNWILDTVSNGCLQDFRPYTIKWESCQE